MKTTFSNKDFRDYNSQILMSGERVSQDEGVTRLKTPRTIPLHPRRGLTMPSCAREFSKYEKKYLNLAGKCSKDRLLMITFIENNLNRNGEIELSYSLVEDILNSGHQTDETMKFLKNVVLIVTNAYSSKEKGIAIHYRISDAFKIANVILDLKHRIDKQKRKTQRKANPKSIQNVSKVIMKTEPEEMIEENTDSEILAIEVIQKRNTHWFKSRYHKVGIDPDSPVKCECCTFSLPSYMFNIMPNGKGLYTQSCAICYKLEDTDNDFPTVEEAAASCKVVLERFPKMKRRGRKITSTTPVHA